MKKKLILMLSIITIVGTLCVGCGEKDTNSVPNNMDDNKSTVEQNEQYIESEIEYFLYEEVEGGIEITGYEFAMHEADYINFPTEIKGNQVVSIGKEAFLLDDIRKIYIPGTIKNIGNSAFYMCKQLEQVTLEEGIEVIEKVAFSNCQKLKSINLVSTIKEIQDGAFLFTNSLKYIEIPTNIEIINESVFCCSGLNNVILPKELKEIRFEAFSSCANLEEIYIPSTVSIIDESAFGEIESNITIKCEAGSYAEEFANKYGIKVEVQ